MREFKATGLAYRQRLHTVMRSAYRSHYRAMLIRLLNTLEFRSNNEIHRPVLDVLAIVKRFAGSRLHVYPHSEALPIKGIVRGPWLEGTTACASDSKKFGAWDQNLLTEWHARYGGRGVMIYWHVDRKSACIYSQLKRCSSSEVAAMIEGVLRHCTDMEVQRQYTDSHGQSQVAFAFCRLLGFELLPRLKAIATQRLYRPDDSTEYHGLAPVLSRTINWERYWPNPLGANVSTRTTAEASRR